MCRLLPSIIWVSSAALNLKSKFNVWQEQPGRSVEALTPPRLVIALSGTVLSLEVSERSGLSLSVPQTSCVNDPLSMSSAISVNETALLGVNRSWTSISNTIITMISRV